MVNDRLRRLEAGAIGETRKLLGIFAYFWVLLSLFSFHKALVLNEENLIFHQGFAFINALALAKVVMAGEFFHIGDNVKNRPLIYPIIIKSAVFAVLLFCFHIVEETFIGLLHGRTLSQSIPSIAGGRVQGMLMIGIIMFVVLMPFFAFRELEQAIGAKELHFLLFGDETGAGAASPIARRNWRTAAAAAALAVLALGGGWLIWAAHQGRAVQYSSQKLEGGSVAETVTANGIVEAAVTVAIGARVTGVIQTLDCGVGLKVKAGQLCAKIDPRLYQATVDQTKSDLAATEVRLEEDKAELARLKTSFKNREGSANPRAISQKSRDASRAAHQQKQETRMRLDEASIARLRAALDAAEANLRNTAILAPVQGTIVARGIEMGDTVAVASNAPPLFRIATDLSVVHVKAKLSENDIDKLRVDGKASFTVESFPNKIFTGEVIQTGRLPQTTETMAAYNVVISVPNAEFALEPGMAARITFMIDRRDNVLRAPPVQAPRDSRTGAQLPARG